MSDTGWTYERVETLTTLWREGLSAAQIARALGQVTRNAVLGKVHRLGLSGRTIAQRTGGQRPAWVKPRPARPKRTAAPHPFAGPNLEIVESVEGPGLVANVLGLGARMCRWPIGDPKSVDFSFCGRGVDLTGPYCPAHRQIAHRSDQPTPLACDPLVRRVLAGLNA